MDDPILTALRKRFAAHADVLPDLLPVLASADPTPFLVRYRRDALQGLDEGTFRRLRSHWREERELVRRRDAARRALDEAGVEDDGLRSRVDASRDRVYLEDVVRPLRRPKKKDGPDGAPVADPMLAVAQGIRARTASEPLDDLLAPFCGSDGAPPTVDDQRSRLLNLLAGLVADDPDARAAVRDGLRKTGLVQVAVTGGKPLKDAYRPLAELSEPISRLKPRTALLLRRAQRAGALQVGVACADEDRAKLLEGPLAPSIDHPHADLLREAASRALDDHLLGAAAAALLRERKTVAERSLLPGIGDTLRDRIMVPPAGRVPIVAVAAGATGSCRIVTVDTEGRPVATVAVHPLAPRSETEEAEKALLEAIADAGATLVAVAGSRRSSSVREWVLTTLQKYADMGLSPIPVNESAADALADAEKTAEGESELPSSVRVALSIGRFVQDPLAECCRWEITRLPLDPNQRDVDQGELRQLIHDVLEDCVAAVGTDVNTAGVTWLSRVPGLDEATARAIVEHRTTHGPFARRTDLRELEAVSEESWQRAGGFLRVRGGEDPLDATGVHPTGADLARAVAERLAVEMGDLLGRQELLANLEAADFAGPVHTESDAASVLTELARGTRDPRGSFLPPVFNKGVRRLRDLKEGMDLDGVVSNLSDFGAFVNVGLRQDGLVHVSELAHGFVESPAACVSVGQRVRVRVLGVDPQRRRISLSIKALEPAPERPPEEARDRERAFGDRSARPGGGGPGGPGRGGPGGSGRSGSRGDRRPGGGRGRRDRKGGGRRGDRGGPRVKTPKFREIPKEGDPFHMQLAALSNQLGFAPPEPPKPKRKPRPKKPKAAKPEQPKAGAEGAKPGKPKAEAEAEAEAEAAKPKPEAEAAKPDPAKDTVAAPSAAEDAPAPDAPAGQDAPEAPEAPADASVEERAPAADDVPEADPTASKSS